MDDDILNPMADLTAALAGGGDEPAPAQAPLNAAPDPDAPDPKALAKAALEQVRGIPKEALEAALAEEKDHPLDQIANGRASKTVNAHQQTAKAAQDALAEQQAQAARWTEYLETRKALRDSDFNVRSAAAEKILTDFSDWVDTAEVEQAKAQAQAEVLTPERQAQLTHSAYTRLAAEVVDSAMAHPFLEGITDADIAALNAPGAAANWADWFAKAATIALKRQGWMSPAEVKAERSATAATARDSMRGLLPQPDAGRSSAGAPLGNGIDMRKSGHALLAEAFEEEDLKRRSSTARRN